MRWGPIIRMLSDKGFTQQQIENMTLYYVFVITKIALCKEDGNQKLSKDELIRYGYLG
jgi:hypothetical protein